MKNKFRKLLLVTSVAIAGFSINAYAQSESGDESSRPFWGRDRVGDAYTCPNGSQNYCYYDTYFWMHFGQLHCPCN